MERTEEHPDPPRSASGPDSTRREHDSGNFRISTETGRRTPV